jgi:hypothetical protein
MPEASVNRGSPRCGLTGVNTRSRYLSAGLLMVALLPVPNTERADCANLADRTRAAAAKVIEALRVYEKCLSSGDAHNDCEREMQTVDDAHDDFVDPVAEAKSCR